MSAECHHTECPEHGYHFDDEGPFCSRSECSASPRDLALFESIETMGILRKELVNLASRVVILQGWAEKVIKTGVPARIREPKKPATPMPLAPWQRPELKDWSIVGMHHYHVDGKRRLYVSMTNNGRVITQEGEDTSDFWNKLASQAVALLPKKGKVHLNGLTDPIILLGDTPRDDTDE